MTSLLKNELSDKPIFGDQRPRILYSPPAPTSAGQEAIDLAEASGLILDPWQCTFLMEALKEREDGRWAAFEIGLMVSRQNGKGSALEALALFGILLGGERLIIWSAHEFKTAKNAMERMVTLLRNSGERFKATNSHGAEGIELLDGPNAGAKILFQTRTKGSGLGLTADRIILDEAMMISPESLQALMFTVAATPNPQIVYTGSAVDQRIHANCEVFGGVRARALEALASGIDTSVCYLEWSCPDDLDQSEFAKPKYWAMANPGMGYRLSVEKISNEYQALRTNPRAFGVQRLGVGDWPVFGDARSEIPTERWQAMIDPKPQFIGSPVVTLYRTREGGRWAIAGAQRTLTVRDDNTEDARIHVDIGYAGEETVDQVITRMIDVITAWAPAAVVVGHGGAAEVLPQLEAAGIEPIVPTTTEEAQACGGFLNDCFVTPPPLSHFDQPNLNNAVAHAIRKDLPSGGFVWAVDNEDTYADLMAATLSRWAVMKFGLDDQSEAMVYDWPTQEEIDAWLEEEDEDDF
ncbi:hypothetical protein FHT44_005110 [Mycolicibacterium sp. BK634]|uniref:hypothetical protein n=1 Tax=Mycolicibacterium sp. BK634 TaxID=2587099 RepID=UPI00160C12FF|nr:hypothetical protein [Mycolicibacterium sp. BK634]MBB3752598.1 hypothetical protein [Mycolicibacterium sp. BK634]